MSCLRALISRTVITIRQHGPKSLLQQYLHNSYYQQTFRQKFTKTKLSYGFHFFFKKHLFLTNSITSGIFMGLGDLINQELEFHSDVLLKNYDWERVGRMFIVGAVLGMGHHFYYIYLDKLLPRADVITVIKKILADQLCAAPLTIVPFFYGVGLLEGKSFEECTAELKEKFLFVYMGDCMFWPPIQFINFYFLPSAFRVFYINMATMVFDVFLSFMKHGFGKEKEEESDHFSWKDP